MSQDDLIQLTQAMPFLDYEPWEKQVEFHKTDKEMRLLAWANRTGKTTSGAHECVLAGMGQHHYIHYPKPPFTIWACSVDYKQMRDSIIPSFEGDATHPRMLPAGVTLNEQKMCYKLPSGSIIRLKSGDSGRKAFQGAAIPLIWIDENLPEDILKEMFIRIGVGFKRRMIWTMTAVDGLSYAYDYVYLPWKNYPEEHDGQPHPRIFYSEAAIWENPYLDQGEIDSLAEKWPPGSKELEVRTKGGFIDLSGNSIFSDNAIKWHKRRCRAPQRYVIEFTDRTTGQWQVRPAKPGESNPTDVLVWELPKEGHYYTAFADIMEGKLSNPQDEESPRDWYVAVVRNRTTRTLAAAIRCRIDPHDGGDLLWLLGHWYNYAWASPEINSAGIATLGVLTGKTGLPVYQRIYRRMKDYDEWAKEAVPDDLGWRTQTNTRNVLVADLFSAVELDPVTKRYEEWICWDLFVEEMKALQRDKAGKIQAIRGRHDDILFAYGGAIQVDKDCPAGNLKPIQLITGQRFKDTSGVPLGAAIGSVPGIMQLPGENLPI